MTEIFAVYAKGDYEQAARLGEASHTAPGLATAARAVLADDVLRETPCLPCLERAEALSRQAIAVDPHHAFGQVWLAVALGYQARITGAVKARSKTPPRNPRQRWTRRWRTIPRMPLPCRPWAAGISKWCAAAAPPWRGCSMARANATALSLFDHSVALAPGNVAVRYQIGLSLAGFDPAKYHARIATELKAAVAAVPATAYEKKIQARAQELLGLLNQREAFDLRVRKYQGFPD